MRSIKTLSLVQFNDESRGIAAFLAIIQRIQAASHSVKTVWRSAQSRASPSPLQFPANREKYSGICGILALQSRTSLSKLHILLMKAVLFCS
jgi:hypothetical protein